MPKPCPGSSGSKPSTGLPDVLVELDDVLELDEELDAEDEDVPELDEEPEVLEVPGPAWLPAGDA